MIQNIKCHQIPYSYFKKTSVGVPMKHKVLIMVFILLFFCMLAAPEVVFEGASEGLLLWFRTVLPTLFPFLVITGLLVKSDAIFYISRLFGPVCSRLFHASNPASFAILGGFLCGYPMGAKLTSDLVIEKRISRKEGEYLLSFCNNTSPAFVISYIFWQNLRKPEIAVVSLAILIIAPVICSYFFRRKLSVSKLGDTTSLEIHRTHSEYHPGTRRNGLGSILDTCIMNGCEAITKIGGYIIVFCILLALLESLPLQGFVWKYLILPSVELTRGIRVLAASSLPFSVRYVLIMALTSFGGFCALFQTQCMVAPSGFSIAAYIKEKLVTALVTSLLSVLVINIMKMK